MHYPFYSKKAILETIQNFGGNIRKSLGQHFLIDPNYVEKIVKIIRASIPEGSTILEIGPGLGAITHRLMEHYRLILVEIDPVLTGILKEYILNYAQLDCQLLQEDILEYFQKNSGTYSYIAGNLPYYITTEIFMEITKRLQPEGLGFFMIQKEYAGKILDKKSSLSIYLHNHGEIKRLFSLPAGCFFPEPEVESSFIVFKKHTQPLSPTEILEKILRMSFRNKRKKIINSWKMGEALLPLEVLISTAKKLDIDLEKRAEDIPMETYYRFAREIETIL